MAQVELTYNRFRISREVVERLLEELKATSLRESEAWLPSHSESDMLFDWARGIADQGGVATITDWSVADQDLITRSFRLPSGEPDLSALDSCGKFDIQMYSSSPAEQSRIKLTAYGRSEEVATLVKVAAHDSSIDELLPAVQRILDESVLPEPEVQVPPFKVFIGHGGDPQWRYLQRALIDTHNIRAEAFESSERAGYHTLVVVDQMVRSSAVAVVVMTGEDVMPDGSLRARENVVHEIGFCQGALGIDRTIIVMEDGVTEPSNITGLTQIRFPRGRLIEIEDRIVSAIQLRQQAHTVAQAR